MDLEGHSEVVARVKSLPLCTAWLPDGRLIIVSSQEGLLLRLEPDGSLVTHANLGRPGWNDIIADGRGNIYVNGPGFNPTAGEAFRPGGVSHVAPDGSVRQVADDIAFPNGMAVTADNSTLIVADSYRHQLVALDIGPDGSLSGRRTWADLGDAAPDGICVDAENAVWYAEVPGKRCARVAEGGTELQTVPAGPGRLRLRPRRPGPVNPAHHRRRMARHDRRPDGGPGQRPGPRRRRRGPGRRLALTALEH